MNITEYKTPYQDVTSFFGVRSGVLYSGFASADGNPINHYGMTYQGLGQAQEKSRLSLGPYLALAALGTNYCWVEAPVMQRNPRNQYASQLMWGFDAVKGFEDKASSKMRGTNMQTLESGELVNIPRAPSNYSDIGIGSMPYAGMRWSDRMGVQTYPLSAVAEYGVMGLNFRYYLSGQFTDQVADVIQIDGTARIATMTYSNSVGYGTLFEPRYFKVCDVNPTSAVITDVGKIQMNNSNDSTRSHVGYSIPLDESLIERDAQGNATAYHLVYGKSQGGQAYPGKLIYKKINLRPWVEPTEEILLEDITTGTWPTIQSTMHTTGIKVEGRSFIYTHAGVRYLVVFYKMGRHTITGYTLPFTIKRAVLTDGVAGAFETITFPVPFPDYGNALVLSPNRKTMWHYSYTGTKIACLSFGAQVTLESQDLMRDGYISAIGVDDNQCLVRTDLNTKLVIRPGVPAPSVVLSFNKAQYKIGDPAVLNITTTEVAPVTIKIEVVGATEKAFTKTVSAGSPASISLTVTGHLQACMVI